MTEEEAKEAVLADVPRETRRKLETFVSALQAEATLQNLVSATTLQQVWHRHILDSAQLLPLGGLPGPWLDIGSGAGLPGMVIAILRDAPTILIEPRTRRAQFLSRVADELGLADRVTVIAKNAVAAPALAASVISARAVASLDALFSMATRFATPDTVWVLPKGRSAADELAVARASWQGAFRLVPSQTDSSASIVVARGVRPK